MTNSYQVFTDGASRGNPGESSCGFVLLDYAGKVRLKYGKKLGVQTNNFAEYMAVVTALEEISSIFPNPELLELDFNLDSNLAVNQLKGSYKIRNSVIMKLVTKIKGLESGYKKVDYRHVPREKNKIADHLVNRVLNTNRDIEEHF